MAKISKLFLLGILILVFDMAITQPFTDFMTYINPYPTEMSILFVIIGLVGLLIGLIGVLKSSSD